jgi:hypothetical protein
MPAMAPASGTEIVATTPAGWLSGIARFGFEKYVPVSAAATSQSSGMPLDWQSVLMPARMSHSSPVPLRLQSASCSHSSDVPLALQSA